MTAPDAVVDNNALEDSQGLPKAGPFRTTANGSSEAELWSELELAPPLALKHCSRRPPATRLLSRWPAATESAEVEPRCLGASRSIHQPITLVLTRGLAGHAPRIGAQTAAAPRRRNCGN
jgi:hypothetical protein